MIQDHACESPRWVRGDTEDMEKVVLNTQLADTLCSPVSSELQILVKAQSIRKQTDVYAPPPPTTGSFRGGSKCQSCWGFKTI